MAWCFKRYQLFVNVISIFSRTQLFKSFIIFSPSFKYQADHLQLQGCQSSREQKAGSICAVWYKVFLYSTGAAFQCKIVLVVSLQVKCLSMAHHSILKRIIFLGKYALINLEQLWQIAKRVFSSNWVLFAYLVEQIIFK